MENKGIRATKLTTDLELPNSAVTDWKKGKYKPSTDAIVKIAEYFGVSTDYLLTGKEKSEFHISGVTNSAVAQGQNLNTTYNNNEVKRAASKEESELLRIFDLLGAKDRMQILNLAFSLEEEEKKGRNI
ncbi:MAG: helix-turn-helix domain-containing protein [Bacteroidales bacterium]|nr:helix-turn-helix domain-containing protein [Bacteroidales bacterium]